MLRDVPIVDGTVRVTCGENLDVTRRVTNVSLTIVDVVLMKGVTRLNNCTLIHLKAIEENSATTKCI